VKIRLNQTMAGPEGIHLQESVIEVSPEMGKALIESRQAREEDKHTPLTPVVDEPMELEGGPQQEIEDIPIRSNSTEFDGIYVSRRPRKNAEKVL
jgi:hypothetical protein